MPVENGMAEHRVIQEPRPSTGEEIANSVSHGVGLLAALVAGSMLVIYAALNNKPWGTISAIVFATTVVAMYAASTLYHALPQGRVKRLFRTLEHCSILLLIAGTYTPITLVALQNNWRWTLFGLVWMLAIVGILLKAVVASPYRWLPGVLYLGLAWLIVVAIRPLSLHMPPVGFWWLLWGGLAYTAGMAFFATTHVKYCHFVWHLFVLAGTSCHFVAVWATLCN